MSAQMILLAFLAGASFATAAGTHPIGNVVTLLQTLKEQAVLEGKQEAESFAQFDHWCTVQTTALKKAIGKEDTLIDQLGSAVAGYTQTEIYLDGDKPEIAEIKADTTLDATHQEQFIEEVDGVLHDLPAQIAAIDTSAGTAETARNKAAAAYSTKLSTLQNTKKAVEDALTEIQTAAETIADETGLLQVTSAKDSLRKAFASISEVASDKEQAMLVNFLSGDNDPEGGSDGVQDQTGGSDGAQGQTGGSSTDEGSSTGGEAAAATLKAAGDHAAHVKAHTFKSHGVIELLKGLESKFYDQIVAATAEETNAINAYALEVQARTAAKLALQKELDEKGEVLGATQSSLAEDEGGLENEESDKTVDTRTLESTETACKIKTEEWETRSKTRANEIEALSMGIKILAKVGGVRTEIPNNPILPASPITFLQVVEDPKQKAVNRLLATAKKVHSKALETLASEISQHLSGPFDVVGDAIQKMRLRLMNEQQTEDKHKEWCDIEIAKTDKSKTSKEDRIKNLDANINSLTSKAAQLKLDITAADDTVADITKYMKESVEVRTAGKEENKLAIKDAEKAQTSLANAVATLETFYKKSGMVAKESYEFAQLPVQLPDSPSTWDSAYSGVADPENAQDGVLAILERIATDFATMEAQTKVQEVEDQKLFDDQMQAHKVEKSRRQKEAEAKGAEQQRKNGKISSLSVQVTNANKELAAVTQYQTDLTAPCVDTDAKAADRKAARAEELASLQSVQELLKQAFTVPKIKFLQVKKH